MSSLQNEKIVISPDKYEGMLFFCRDVLQISSAHDWACKNLESFNEAHKLRLVVPVLRALKIFQDDSWRCISKGGVYSSCKHWEIQEWLKFYDCNFSSIGDWIRRSPETHDVARKLGLLKKLKELLGIVPPPSQWSEMDEESLLQYLKINKIISIHHSKSFTSFYSKASFKLKEKIKMVWNAPLNL